MTLGEFLESGYFEIWDGENRSPGSARMIVQEPERFDPIMAAAEHGAEGSTHGEVIDDWREALQCAVQDGVVTEGDGAAIEVEIDRCEAWHEEHGSLGEVMG